MNWMGNNFSPQPLRTQRNNRRFDLGSEEACEQMAEIRLVQHMQSKFLEKNKSAHVEAMFTGV